MKKFIIFLAFILTCTLIFSQTEIETGMITEEYEVVDSNSESTDFTFNWRVEKKKGKIICEISDKGRVKDALSWDIVEYFSTDKVDNYLVIGSELDRMIIVFDKEVKSVAVINMRTREYVATSGENIKYKL